MSERTPFRLRSFGRLAEETGSAARNLWAQKTRTLLTGLGMVFGVGAVICMLAISAGARAQALHFIEELGVRNLFVTSLPARSVEEMQSRRKSSPGLTARDVRILQANLGGLEAISPRRTLHPVRLIPKPDGGGPELVGVGHAYASIHNLRISNGRFFDDLDDETAAAVCVLGENAKVQLLGYGIATGKFVKVNDTWLRVIGVLARQFRSSQRSSAAEADPDHAIYVPLRTFQYRFWDSGFLTDELDGIDLGLAPGVDSSQAARVVSTILNATHRNTPDFAVIVPAELLEQQQRTARIFAYVMVAIAAISLLVGGIGIMNIVLATVLERTREIGIRRATGAGRGDIVRQFLAESVLISAAGGAFGIGFGCLLSWTIARLAHWETVVTVSSVLLAFGVSLGVGVVFGIFPALKAARIDPIEALRYE